MILVSPPGSPVLSPINVVHSDLPSYKDSPREDQVHGYENISSQLEVSNILRKPEFVDHVVWYSNTNKLNNGNIFQGDVNGVHGHNGRYEESLTRDQVNPLDQNTPKEVSCSSEPEFRNWYKWKKTWTNAKYVQEMSMGFGCKNATKYHDCRGFEPYERCGK